MLKVVNFYYYSILAITYDDTFFPTKGYDSDQPSKN